MGLVLTHLASEPEAGCMEIAQQQWPLSGGYHLSYPASAESHTHRSLCKLCLGRGSCWLVHGEHSIAPLQNR